MKRNIFFTNAVIKHIFYSRIKGGAASAIRRALSSFYLLLCHYTAFCGSLQASKEEKSWRYKRKLHMMWPRSYVCLFVGIKWLPTFKWCILTSYKYLVSSSRKNMQNAKTAKMFDANLAEQKKLNKINLRAS